MIYFIFFILNNRTEKIIFILLIFLTLIMYWYRQKKIISYFLRKDNKLKFNLFNSRNAQKSNEIIYNRNYNILSNNNNKFFYLYVILKDKNLKWNLKTN